MLGKFQHSTKIAVFISIILLFLLSVFTSCDNFINGNLIKEEIQKQIEYSKAAAVDILIAPELSTHGTTYPNGNKTYKVTDNFTVSFKANSGYQFVKWEVIDYTTGTVLADILDISTPYSLETSVTVLDTADNVQLYPVVYENLGLSFKPVEVEAGEPKDSSIVITFTEDISEDNDLSRIGITSGGISVADNYKEPVLNGNTITIAADITNLIEVASGKTKTVSVSIPDDFYYEKDGQKVSIGNTKIHTFKINSTTTEQAEVTCSVAASKGTVTPTGTLKYSIGEEFKLKFEQNEDYTFYYWNVLDAEGNEISEDDVYIEDKTALKTKVRILSPVKGVNINPKSIQTLNISDWSPKMDEAGVSKDSSIVITLNKEISEDNDLSAIKITCAGNDVTSCFKTPVLNGNILTIAADKTNLLDVSKDEIKTITVSLPSDFYYVEDGENVSMGQVTSFNYKINSTTTEQTEITFGSVANEGEMSQSGTKKFDLGTEIELVFSPKEGYIFKKWNILDSDGKDVSESILHVSEKNKTSIKITVKSSAAGISITPDCVMSPAVTENTPEFSSEGVFTNTSISCVFNMPMEKEDVTEGSTLFTFDNIQIISDGEDITRFFNNPVLSDDKKTLTIKPKAMDLKNFIVNKNAAYINVNIVLKDTIKVEIEGESYSILEDKKSNWSFRYKAAVENVAPANVNFVATTKVVNLNTINQLDEKDKFVLKAFSDFTKEDVFQNVVSNSIYIYGNFYDGDTGVKSLIIEETRTNKKENGSAIDRSNKPNAYDFTKEISANELNMSFDGTGYAEACFKYDLCTVDEGAILIKVYAKDNCDNKSEAKEVTVIKANTFDFSEISPYNYKKTTPFDKTAYEAAIKTIHIGDGNTKKTIYKDIKQDTQLMCQYVNDEGKTIKENMTFDSQKSEWLFTFNKASVTSLQFTVLVVDAVGIVYNKNFYYPGQAFVSYTEGTESAKDLYITVNGSTTAIYQYFYDGSSSSFGETQYTSCRVMNQQELQFAGKFNDLFGELSEIYTTSSTKAMGENNSNLKFKNISLESAGVNTGKYYVNTEIDSSLWDEFDNIYYQVLITPSGAASTSYKRSFSPENNFAQTEVETKYIYGNQCQTLTMYGITKDGIAHKGVSIKYPPALNTLSDPEQYINVEPTVITQSQNYNSRKTSDYQKLTFCGFIPSNNLSLEKKEWWTSNFTKPRTDGVSDYVLEKTVGQTTKTYNYISIPLWDIDDNTTVYVRGTDVNGNYDTVEYEYCYYPELEYKILDYDKVTKKGNFIIKNDLFPEVTKHLIIEKYDSTTTKTWVAESSKDTTDSSISDYTIENIVWIRYRTEYETTSDEKHPHFSDWTYFFTGDPATDIEFYEMDSNIFINSSKSVIIRTLCSQKPYEECKNWTPEQWNHNRQLIKEEVFSAKSVNYNKVLTSYKIDTSSITEGACYVTLVYFAGGTVKMTEPKIK